MNERLKKLAELLQTLTDNFGARVGDVLLEKDIKQAQILVRKLRKQNER